MLSISGIRKQLNAINQPHEKPSFPYKKDRIIGTLSGTEKAADAMPKRTMEQHQQSVQERRYTKAVPRPTCTSLP